MYHTQNLANAVLVLASTFSATSAKDCNPIDTTKPFKLTAVTSSGTTYPLAVGAASRGVSVLSTVGQDVSPDTFVLNGNATRVAPVDHPTLLSAEVRPEQPFIFTGTDDFDPVLVYVDTDCRSYLVKGSDDAGAEVDTQSWTSNPPSPEGLTVEVDYHGPGGNSAIRLDSA